MVTGVPMEMPAAQFRVRFFELLDEIAASGESVVITKHGKAVVRVIAERPPATLPIHGCMAGRAEILGDIESPVLPPLDEFIDNDLD